MTARKETPKDETPAEEPQTAREQAASAEVAEKTQGVKPEPPFTGTEDAPVTVLGHTREQAVLLLDAAIQLDLPVEVVRTTSEGFEVPVAVRDKAFGK